MVQTSVNFSRHATRKDAEIFRRRAYVFDSLAATQKTGTAEWVRFLAENLRTLLSASIAFVRTNARWAKPKPLYKQEEQE